ncbi:MAG: preprotein translocase subunit YajC [Kiritimatiellae bacterium]|nr:preprotein translocase subunit YajC [Kiritimatiellia bacterium]
MNETTETTATEVQPADGGAQGAAGVPQQQGGFGMMVPMLLILAIFYFMMIRPQQRKEKERRKMIDELRAGAKVVFAGGIIGTIVEASEKTFVVETREGCRMEVLRSCVQGVVGTESAEAK